MKAGVSRTTSDTKDNWQSVPLAELLEVQNGYAFSSKKFSEADGTPLIRIRDLKNDGKTAVRFLGNFDKSYCVSDGDLLIGMDGEFVCYQWSGGQALLNQRVCRLVDFSDNLLPRFVFYGINKFLKEIEDRTTFTTVKHLSSKKIKAIKFPVPPLEEQKRIVAVLDQAFAALDRARAHAEANLADAGELFETVKESASDEVSRGSRYVSLADVSRIESTLVDPQKPDFMDLPHLGAGNMQSGSDELVHVMTAREEKLKSAKYLFNGEDVLYSKIRPYLRKAARPDFAGLCSADVYPLRPNYDLDRNFLFHLLLGQKFTEYAISGSARAGMPKVNRKHLFAYQFRLPPIHAQRDAAIKIDDAWNASNKLQNVFLQKRADIADLRQSILQKAFAGELT